jgi:UDP-glucose 4-epimerase
MASKVARDILLIGGTGFIGTALSRHLAQRGFNICVVDQSDFHPEPVRRTTYFTGDLSDGPFIRPLLDRCQTIIHLASSTTPTASADSAAMEAETNILPTLRLIDHLRECEPKHLLFVSSGGTLYGNPLTLPVPEAASIQPLSFHGAGKAALELFFRVSAHTTHHVVTVLRPSNIYGPGQPLKKGFGVIRTMLEHLSSGTTMEIWGDGKAVRDYLFIDDMLEAVSQFIDTEDHIGGTFNVGAGIGHHLNEVITIAEYVTGKKLSIRHHPQRIIDVQHIVLDCAELKARTRWQPKVTLDTGIRKTWAWLTS